MRACPQCGSGVDDKDRFCRRCGGVIADATSRDPLIGRTVGGSYVVLELVGVGGMGRVYRAEQSVLGRTVAIKVVHPHLLSDEQSVARFYTEARTASRLNHPNSVGIIDFGRTDDGILYLVMEFLRGRDLAKVMRDEGPLPFARVAEIGLGVLAALGEAHAIGIVHRDLKPENIVLEKTRSGEVVKVVDFGLAKIASAGARSSSVTSPGLICGTPDYMSPEQGRGEDVDGRGDLYAVGIVLFELLADRLPFSEETPARVVLRHINDPIPDPRLVAPQRGIPSALAEIAMTAMAKYPTDRFQTAEEMAGVLRRALGSIRTPAQDTGCANCGAINAPSARFCQECGARIGAPLTKAPPPRIAQRSGPIAAAQPLAGRPLVGRQRELAMLDDLLDDASVGAVRVEIVGEVGVGKTRLLRELTRRAEEKGDVVAFAGPNPIGALVPYEPIRTLMTALLGVELDGLAAYAEPGGPFVDAAARAGVSEMLAPTGVIGSDGRDRAAAVALALVTAARVAVGRSTSGRAVLAVDDLGRCDRLSRAVLAGVPSTAPGLPILVATTSVRAASSPAAHARVIPLPGLDRKSVSEMLAGSRATAPPPSLDPTGEETLLFPLYVEQLRALGFHAGDETAPQRLADAVAARIDRLDVRARRVLQAASVLGDACSLAALAEVHEDLDPEALDKLEKEGLIFKSDRAITFAHPFVRELIEASIPAEARKQLHERVLQVHTGQEAPLEVRAEHAFRAGEPMGALVLLEQMGDAAITRGDPHAAVLAFQRALDLARREVLETGDTVLDRAIVTFSRKLGDALDRSGDATGAEGVVRESLDLVGRDSVERARMLLVLGRAGARRERYRDALRWLAEGVEIAQKKNDPTLTADIHAAIAKVRRIEGDALGAANSLREAVDLLSHSGASAIRRAACVIDLGEALIEAGDVEQGAREVERGIMYAKSAEAPSLAAIATAMLGTLSEVNALVEKASAQYRDAAQLAAACGDLETRDRWTAAASALDRSTHHP